MSTKSHPTQVYLSAWLYIQIQTLSYFNHFRYYSGNITCSDINTWIVSTSFLSLIFKTVLPTYFYIKNNKKLNGIRILPQDYYTFFKFYRLKVYFSTCLFLYRRGKFHNDTVQNMICFLSMNDTVLWLNGKPI